MKRAELVLLLATAIWGLAFLVTRHAVADVPVAPFLALRFATACIVVRLATGVRVRAASAVERRAGLALGLAMFAGYALQAEGLRRLDAGTTAFISALYVPLVPLLQIAITRVLPSLRQWVSMVLACCGLMLMTGAQLPVLGGAGLTGAGFALGGAVAIAFEITLVGYFAARVDPRRLAVLECGLVALLAGVIAGFEGGFSHFGVVAVACGLGLGAASAFLQISSNWAMRHVVPARAILIFATEPVWAAAFGAMAGERMAGRAWAGAALILAALLSANPTPME